MTVLLKPFSNTKLILGRTQKLWYLLGMLTAVVENKKNFALDTELVFVASLRGDDNC